MNTEMPPYWNVYVTVADADETLEEGRGRRRHRRHGADGGLRRRPMGVAQDAVGSFISVWQPNRTSAPAGQRTRHVRLERAVDERPGQAKEFYMAVFGWGVDDNASSDGGAIFTVDGNIVCGAHTAGEGEFPAWSVWFGVGRLRRRRSHGR